MPRKAVFSRVKETISNKYNAGFYILFGQPYAAVNVATLVDLKHAIVPRKCHANTKLANKRIPLLAHKTQERNTSTGRPEESNRLSFTQHPAQQSIVKIRRFRAVFGSQWHCVQDRPTCELSDVLDSVVVRRPSKRVEKRLRNPLPVRLVVIEVLHVYELARVRLSGIHNRWCRFWKRHQIRRRVVFFMKKWQQSKTQNRLDTVVIVPNRVHCVCVRMCVCVVCVCAPSR